MFQFTAIFVSGLFTVAAGFAFGFSAVLLPALREDDTFPYDEELASWIGMISISHI